MTPLSLSWVRAGDVIRVQAIDNREEPIMVLSHCGLAIRGYHCDTHRQALANIGQVVLHCEDGGEHRIATWCSHHRRYEAPDALQVEAFAKLIEQEAAAARGES